MEQLDKIIESGIYELVKNVIVKNKNALLIEEGLFCFMNFTYNANKKQMEYFINLKFLEILVAQMTMRKK